MRRVDPAITIVSGGLAPAADTADGTGVAPTTFLNRILDAGATSFDAFAVHPYSYPAGPIDPASASLNPFHNLPETHATSTARGQGQKKIWLTEYGAPTGTSRRAVSEEEQSAQTNG